LQLAEEELDRHRSPSGIPGSRPPLSYPRGEVLEDEDVL